MDPYEEEDDSYSASYYDDEDAGDDEDTLDSLADEFNDVDEDESGDTFAEDQD